MRGGHQVIKTAGATQHAGRMARIPVWALDDMKIKKILLRSFPDMKTDEKQRKRAAIWYEVIYQYWRVGRTRGQVAGDLGLTERQVKDTLLCISRVASGKAANGSKKPHKGYKQGRPKKRSPIETSSGTTGDRLPLDLKRKPNTSC